MPDAANRGQSIPRLSQLITAADIVEEESWTIHDLAEDAVAMFSERVREEFADEVKEIAETADEADLEVLTRAFRHCREKNGMEAALPGRLLASILLQLGINDLGTGRSENTRRMLALRNARERLTKAGVPFVDDANDNAREGA